MILIAIYATCMVCNLFLVRFAIDGNDERDTFILCGFFTFPFGLVAAILALCSYIRVQLKYKHDCNKSSFLIEQFNKLIG